jgi:hypothetical protein
MKINYELMDDSNLDAEDLEAERDLQLAAVDAIRRARRFGTSWVIREGNVIKDIPPDQTAPYEDRLLASAAVINQRILALKRIAPSDLSLNDKPML